MVSDLKEYRINKHFNRISSLIYQIVQLKQTIRILSTGCKFNYRDHITNNPAGVDKRLLHLLLERQNQRLQLLIDLEKRKKDLKKTLWEVSRELGETCRYECLTEYNGDVVSRNI